MLTKRGHQHHVPGDEGAAADDGARHGAEAGGLELRRRPSRRTCRGPCPTRDRAPSGLARMTALGVRRKDSRIACLGHWWVIQAPSAFSATRASPASRRSRVSSTASRTGPLVSGDSVARVPAGLDLRLAGRRGDIGSVIRRRPSGGPPPGRARGGRSCSRRRRRSRSGAWGRPARWSCRVAGGRQVALASPRRRRCAPARCRARRSIRAKAAGVAWAR